MNSIEDLNSLFTNVSKDPSIADDIIPNSANNKTAKSKETHYRDNFDGTLDSVHNISLDHISINDEIKNNQTTSSGNAELKNPENKENNDKTDETKDYIQCQQCEAIFGTSRGLLYHKNSKHLGFKYGCNQCNSTFTFPSALSTHKLLLHNNEIYYQCDQCELSLRSENSLKRHKKFIHNKKYKATCEKCPRIRIFQNVSTLRQHHRFKHEGALQHMNIKQERKDHILKSKLEDKKYKCDQCEWKSDSRLRLKIHVQSIHEGIYHFCNQCDRSYATLSGLVHHKRLIHDKKPSKAERNLTVKFS